MAEDAGARWPPELDLLNRIDDFLDQWPEAEFGPGHIVLSDFNLEDAHLAYCLQAIADGEIFGHPLDEVVATAAFLRTLQAVPPTERERVMDLYVARS